jgi:hypothetical protein
MQQGGTGRILPQRLFRADYSVTETIEALRRKLRQPASSAVMILVMRSARGKNSWDCASRSQF